MKDKIKKFLEKNFRGVEFTGLYNSEYNGIFTILCGYADFIGASKDDIASVINEKRGEEYLPEELEKELDKVFDFAKTYQYGKWWNSEQAKKEYKF